MTRLIERTEGSHRGFASWVRSDGSPWEHPRPESMAPEFPPGSPFQGLAHRVVQVIRAVRLAEEFELIVLDEFLIQ